MQTPNTHTKQAFECANADECTYRHCELTNVQSCVRPCEATTQATEWQNDQEHTQGNRTE